MKKKELFILSLLFILIQGVSSKEYTYLVLHFKSGNSAIYPIEQQPKITFSEGAVSIDTERFLFSNISKYTFENATYSGIEEIESNGHVMKMENDALYVQATSASMPFRLFQVDGMEIPVKVESAGEYLVKIDLAGLKSGVYILQMGSEAIKIKKK